MASENKPLLGPELIESNGFRYVRESERERERERERVCVVRAGVYAHVL